jgi:hypothetical protein
LRKIRIDFVNPKYNFIREIDIYEDEIQVRDPSFY